MAGKLSLRASGETTASSRIQSEFTAVQRRGDIKFNHTHLTNSEEFFQYSKNNTSLKAMACLRNWGVLNRPIKAEHNIAVACIGACSLLHNMLIAREDCSAFSDDLDDKEQIDQKEVSLDAKLVQEEAAVIRNALATRAKMNTLG